jgi:HSP20 family protein
MTHVKFNRMNPAVNFFDQMLHKNFNQIVGNDNLWSSPAVNVYETEKDYQLEIAAPGLAKDDFKIELEKNKLNVKVEKQKEIETEETPKGTYTRREFGYFAFNRSFTLPENVDIESILGNYENGILHLAIPKSEIKKPDVKTIEIK